MSTLLSLPPNVEERMSGWVKIQERRVLARERQEPGPAVTLSRAYGCEGFPLALRLQERLEAATGEPWALFDKALLDRVAQEEGISRHLLNDLGDPSRSLEAFGFHPRGAVTHDEAYTKVARTLLVLAGQGRAIIVGRGGAILCHGLSNAFHFRLEADLAWRAASIARRMGLGLEEAERLVKAQTRQRDQFIKDALGAEVGDPRFYDAVFNNERHSVDRIAAAIAAFVLGGR